MFSKSYATSRISFKISYLSNRNIDISKYMQLTLAAIAVAWAFYEMGIVRGAGIGKTGAAMREGRVWYERLSNVRAMYGARKNWQ